MFRPPGPFNPENLGVGYGPASSGMPTGGGAGGYGPQIYIQGKLSDSGYRRWMDWYSNRHIYCVKPNRFAKFYAKISIV